MDAAQILDMIATNREYIKRKSNIAVQNLAMLHKSFDAIDDESCAISLSLNDSLAAMLFSADYARSVDISLSSLERFPGSPYTFLIASHESAIGRCYTMMTRYDLGKEYLLRAEAKAMTLEGEEERGLLADILHDLAMTNHHAGGNSEETIRYLDRALDVLEPTGFRMRRGICYMGIGNVRYNQGRPADALAYYKKAEPFFEDTDSIGNHSAVLCNIGMCYTSLEEFDAAELYLMRALDMRTRLGSYWEIANSYYNLALFYKLKRDLSKAYENLLIARDYALVGQAKGLKLIILKELETAALALGETAAAAAHSDQYKKVEGEAA